MYEKFTINTKSIPSFTILLPVVSLVSITLFVLIMINGIKDDLLESDIKEIKLQQETLLRKELKDSIDKALLQSKAILESKILENKELLRTKLSTLITHLKQSEVNHKVNHSNSLIKHITIFNKTNPLFHITMVSNKDLRKLLTRIQRKNYKRTKGSYVNGFFSLSNPNSSLKYVKKFKNLNLLITLKREIFIQKSAHEIAQMLTKIHHSKKNIFHIYKSDRNQNLTSFFANQNDFIHDSLKHPEFIKKVLNQNGKGFFSDKRFNGKEYLVYAQEYHFLNWILSIHTQKSAMEAIQKIKLDKKSLYFEKKSEELLIVIIVVSSVVLLLSLVVAKIITIIFTDFKNQIEDTNKRLKNFNKELSLQISEKTTELKKSEERYRTIFECSPDGVLILDDKHISYCNGSSLKMLGVELEDLINAPLTKIFPQYQPNGHKSEKLLQNYLDIAMALGHSRFEMLLEKSNKQKFYVDGWLQIIKLENTQIIYFNFRDIDFQKNAQEKIKEQHQELILLNETLEDRVTQEVIKNQEKEQYLVHQSRLAQMGEMISMIAHQWRQPLSAISTSSANMKLLIELGQYNEDVFFKNFDQIDTYIQHLSQTINDFRNFFKPDNKIETTTIDTIVSKSLNIIAQSLKGNEIDVTISIDKSAEVSTYVHELMQVILNLLKNSQDILLERDIKDRHINITYIKKEHLHELRFGDNAGGIPVEIIDKIFDPYFSTKNQKNGTGLGLYMSRVIVMEHCRGTLTVENNEKGAVFIISLPMD